MVRSRDSRRGKREDSEPLVDSFLPSRSDSLNTDLNSIELDDLRHRSPDYEEIRLKRRLYSQIPLIARFQKLIEGPEYPIDDPPVITIQSLVPLERFPTLLRHQKYPSKYRFLVLIAYLTLWFLLIYSIISPHFHSGAVVPNSDIEVISLSCTGGDHFWKGKNQHCGLDGNLCEPFRDKEVVIKCPALCDRGWTYSSTPVGDKMVKYRQFTIGGGKSERKSKSDENLTLPYRGDSFPCSSAVHSGIISPYFGGCVRLSFDGSKLSFNSKDGNYGSGPSISFPSYFPSSFIFKILPKGTTNCYDPRLLIMVLNFFLGIPVIYLTTGVVGFSVSSIVGFWTVVLSLDPPVVVNGDDPETVAQLISTGLQRLLPMSFVLYVIWITTVKTTFQDPSSPLCKVLLWYPLFWTGIANNITFDRLPVDRLTPQDIQQQPGGLITIIGIIVTLIIAISIQGYHVWRAGKFEHYFKVYGTIVLGLIFLANLPNLQLRIHHYILGLMLIPGTGTKGITAFPLQGVLLGLFISGVARWNFDSIVESHVSLLRGEAGTSEEPPANLTFAQGVISWSPTVFDNKVDPDHTLDGYSILINDIERYVGNDTSVYLKDIIENDKVLNDVLYNSKEVLPLYLRLAKSSTEKDSLDRGDYTMAGIIEWPSGKWTEPAEGVS